MGPAIDVVALALAAHGTEPDPLGDTDRRVLLDTPGVDRAQPELAEPNRQHCLRRAARVTPPRVRLVAENHPVVGGPEVYVDVGERGDADRTVVVIGSEQADRAGAALHRHLQPFKTDDLAAVSEIEPLMVLLLGQPPGEEPQVVRRVWRLELHVRPLPPRRLRGS